MLINFCYFVLLLSDVINFSCFEEEQLCQEGWKQNPFSLNQELWYWFEKTYLFWLQLSFNSKMLKTAISVHIRLYLMCV